MKLRDLDRFFTDKAALNTDFQHSGDNGGEKPKRKARSYFVSKRPGPAPTLDSSERPDGEVLTPERLQS